eukprot:Unigene5046_Nuclearia_a/m.15475 Unigene5046_Nuclearia_a/g.15475  ORF Unigene5046_Nuclearia_a/g.15475 Unigene5046_Nuclearia_a/m.15475 type:complete len:301 (-) Unigene5046_Nuclearia_a:10-912(-)
MLGDRHALVREKVVQDRDKQRHRRGHDAQYGEQRLVRAIVHICELGLAQRRRLPRRVVDLRAVRHVEHEHVNRRRSVVGVGRQQVLDKVHVHVGEHGVAERPWHGQHGIDDLKVLARDLRDALRERAQPPLQHDRRRLAAQALQDEGVVGALARAALVQRVADKVGEHEHTLSAALLVAACHGLRLVLIVVVVVSAHGCGGRLGQCAGQVQRVLRRGGVGEDVGEDGRGGGDDARRLVGASLGVCRRAGAGPAHTFGASMCVRQGGEEGGGARGAVLRRRGGLFELCAAACGVRRATGDG